MATVTGPEQHGALPGMSYSKDSDIASSQSYGLVPEDEISPCSPLFPGHQPSAMMGAAASGPLPNPPFVFPARPGPSSAPSSFSRATGRRPRSAYELQGGSSGFARETQIGIGRTLPAPLPSFSFNSTITSTNDTGISSPPQSPQSPQSMSSTRSIPSRPGGHRRGGSEFIGGDGMSSTGVGLMSTSPTKGEGVLPSPTTTSSLGPSAGRRGHAHRRSAAISCHDLSFLNQPQSPNPVRGGSAPTSPSDKEYQSMSFPRLDSAVQNIPDEHGQSEPVDMSSPPDSPRRVSNRPRVGFSDNVEFIPRPLSLVSSDTSSTTTMRPGHSVSNSLSSVMSIGAGSPPSNNRAGLSSPPNTHRNNDCRPSTAGAVLGSSADLVQLSGEVYRPRRRSSLPYLLDGSPVADTDPTPNSLPKKYFFFGHESAPKESSPARSRPVSSGSEKAKSPLSGSSAPSSPGPQCSDIPMASNEAGTIPVRKTSLTRKPSKKQKKVKSWAGSIFPRKPRQRSKKQKAVNRRSPTPPLRSYEPTPEPDDNSAQLTESNLPVNVEEKPHSPGMPQLKTDFASWKPRHVTQQDDESMSPIIDLDAALGPFNTPSGYDPDWEASQRGPGGSKRKMHSAAGKSGFISPYHRRAESAPEMVAFENPRFSLHHIGSRSTMEDVFEEDEEEDEWEEMKSVSHRGSKTPVGDEEDAPGLGINIRVVDAESSKPENVMDWTIDSTSSIQRGVKRKGSGLSEGERRQVSSSSKSERSIGEESVVVTEDNNSLKVFEKANDSRPTSAKTTTSESSPTPPLHPTSVLRPVDIQPIIFQHPFLTPNSPQSSSHSPFPSPRSPMSYDAQRISTAPSSFTDEQTFQSLLLGEPGPEIRMSVDDVPSLTSSNSTMTRESAYNPAFNNPQFRGGQRSASLSSPSITRKRSSMASLSRLLTSSHGEKSKLSIEERAPSSPEKKEKGGRGKRLSRLMQFWKPKEESDS